MNIHQYQILVVNLDSTIGSEIKKTRPCLVLSPDEMNAYLKTVVIAPITSTIRNYPTRTSILVNGKISRVALDQIRTIDKKRIVNVLGTIKVKEIIEIKAIISKTYVE